MDLVDHMEIAKVKLARLILHRPGEKAELSGSSNMLAHTTRGGGSAPSPGTLPVQHVRPATGRQQGL